VQTTQLPLAIHLSAIKSIDNSPGGIFFQQRSALAALVDEGQGGFSRKIPCG